MSKIQINKLINANVYMNGSNLLGRAEEVQLPQIKHKMAEHKALGMVGSAEFFSGIEKLECKPLSSGDKVIPSTSLCKPPAIVVE